MDLKKKSFYFYTDLEIVTLSEVNQRTMSYETSYMWNLTDYTNEHI